MFQKNSYQENWRAGFGDSSKLYDLDGNYRANGNDPHNGRSHQLPVCKQKIDTVVPTKPNVSRLPVIREQHLPLIR